MSELQETQPRVVRQCFVRKIRSVKPETFQLDFKLSDGSKEQRSLSLDEARELCRNSLVFGSQRMDELVLPVNVASDLRQQLLEFGLIPRDW